MAHRVGESLVSLAILALVAAVPSQAASLRVRSANVRLSAARTDNLVLGATVEGFPLDAPADVELRIGHLVYAVPASSFRMVAGTARLRVRGPVVGLKSLKLDARTGRLRALVRGVILSALSNPLSVRLTVGSVVGCTMVALTEAPGFRMLVSGAAQFPCTMPDPPITDATAVLVSTPTSLRVQVRVAGAAPDPGSLQLWRAGADLAPTGLPLCTFGDDGDLTNGDDIFADGVHSCFATIAEPDIGRVRLLAHGTVGGAPVRSPVFSVDVVRPLTPADGDTILSVQQQAATIWQEVQSGSGDTLQARIDAAGRIALLPGVARAGVASDGATIWFEHASSGVQGSLLLNTPGSRGGGPESPFTPVRAAASASPRNPIGSTRVIIWDAWNSEFSPFDEGPTISQLFGSNDCPKFDVTYLVDDQCTVDSLRNLADFGTIVLISHGVIDGRGDPVIYTREVATPATIQAYALDLSAGRIGISSRGGVPYFVVRPSFIASLPGHLSDAFVYAGACFTDAAPGLGNAFLAKGARTFLGYDHSVRSAHASVAGEQLFRDMVQNGDTSAGAFASVVPKADVAPPHGSITQRGDGQAAYSGQLLNPGFETGLVGWSVAGDGRAIGGLGPFGPTEGALMGIVSTGLGFTTTSGAISATFCLPSDASRIAFDWNYSSEEFVEWCGPREFDDPLLVELITSAGTTVLLSHTVDSLCGTVAPTPLAFDETYEDCEPTGTNDCKVWSTGWRTEAVNVASVAAANAGKGVTLRFAVSDAGDSSWDTAVLVDDVRVVSGP